MEQRRLRLGDILDDYCPRERRVTNHAIVAMIDETVKQTRCTTCDADHPYKGGQAPRRRKKEGTSALFKEVLAGKGDAEADAPRVTRAIAAQDPDDSPDTDPDVNSDQIHTSDEDDDQQPMASDAAGDYPAYRGERSGGAVERHDDAFEDAGASREAGSDVDLHADAESSPAQSAEEGPVHRQLIRATLPRIEGFKEERRPTDFTIRQSTGRGGNNPGNQFRGGGGNDRARHGRGGQGGQGGPGGNAGFGGNAHRGNGNRGHGGQRFAQRGQGSGQGQGRGPGQGGQGGGFRSSQQPRPGGGRKRSR